MEKKNKFCLEQSSEEIVCYASSCTLREESSPLLPESVLKKFTVAMRTVYIAINKTVN
jgi:hypothetical protein